MENRHGLVIGVDVRHAIGTGKRDGALDLLTAAGVLRGATLGADKGYDTQDFVAALKTRGIVPHIARNTGNGRRSVMPRVVAGTRAARGGDGMTCMVMTSPLARNADRAQRVNITTRRDRHRPGLRLGLHRVLQAAIAPSLRGYGQANPDAGLWWPRMPANPTTCI